MPVPIIKAAAIPIDLTGWFLNEIPDLNGIALRAAGEVLKAVFEGNDESPSVYFPIGWGPDSDGLGGKPPDNPLTVYLRIPFYDGISEAPTWKFTLDDLVADISDLYQLNTRDTPLSSSERSNMESIRDALRKLADKLDAAICENYELDDYGYEV